MHDGCGVIGMLEHCGASFDAIDDIRCLLHRGLMRNREHRDLAGEALQRSNDACLRLRIERGGGLVEN